MSSTITTTTDDDIVAALLVKALDALPEVAVDGVTYSLAPISDGRVGLYRYDDAADDEVLAARVTTHLEVTPC